MKMRIRQLKPFIPNEDGTPFNAFLQDFVHVGTPIGKNIMMMEGNKDQDGNVGYMVMINLLTGERKMIYILPSKVKPLSFLECISYIFRSTKDVSLWDKLCWHVRNNWDYRPWLKPMFR